MSGTNVTKKGTIELYEGLSKKDKKPFTALTLKVGTWSVLYFPQSKFEMDYIKDQLTEKQRVMGSIDLNDDEVDTQKGDLFN